MNPQLQNAIRFAKVQTDEDGKTRLVVERNGAVSVIFPHQIEHGDEELERIEKKEG